MGQDVLQLVGIYICEGMVFEKVSRMTIAPWAVAESKKDFASGLFLPLAER